MSLNDSQRQLIRECSKDDASYQKLLQLYESAVYDLPPSPALTTENENFFNSVLLTLPGLVYLYDLCENRNVFVNPYITDVLGYELREFQANIPLVERIIHPDDLPMLNENLDTIRHSPDKFTAEVDYRIRYRNGGWLWMRAQHTAYSRNADGSTRLMLGVAVNIQRLKEVEQELKNSQHFFRQIMLAIPDIVYVFDAVTLAINFINIERATELFNCAVPEVKTLEDVLSFVHPDDREQVAKSATWYHDAADDDFFEMEYRVIIGENLCWLGGRQVIMERDSQGKPRQILGTAEDITPRRMAMSALLASETRMKALLSAIPDMMFIFDGNGTYIDVHAPEGTMLIAPASELIGKRLKEVFPLEKRIEEDYISRTLSTGEMSEYHYSVKFEDGLHYFECRMVLHDADTVLAIVRDITLKTRAELALQESHRWEQALLEAIPDMMFVLDKDGVYLDYHASNTALLLVPPEGFLGQNILDILPAEQREKAIELVHRTLETGDISEYEYSLSINHSAYHFEARFVPRDAESVIVIVRDVTGQKEAQNLQLEQERLEIALQKEQELGRYKSRLMTTLNHELRTPLAIISTNSAMLERYKKAMPPEKQEERLRQIQKQTQHIGAIMDNIHMVLRGETERIKPVYRLFDIQELIRHKVESLLIITANTHSLQFYAGDVREVYTDERLVDSIVINLLTNAIKYSPAGSTITVTLNVSHRDVIIEVADQGIGIIPEDQEHIFKPFFRGVNTGESGGIGLGMSIVHEAVEVLHGTIDLDSTAGKGTRFTITLPGISSSQETHSAS